MCKYALAGNKWNLFLGIFNARTPYGGWDCSSSKARLKSQTEWKTALPKPVAFKSTPLLLVQNTDTIKQYDKGRFWITWKEACTRIKQSSALLWCILMRVRGLPSGWRCDFGPRTSTVSESLLYLPSQEYVLCLSKVNLYWIFCWSKAVWFPSLCGYIPVLHQD